MKASRPMLGVLLAIAILTAQRSVAAASEEAIRADSTTRAQPLTSDAPAPTHIRPGDKIYIQPTDFGMALAAAILKKEVPVAVTTDSAKADFWISTTSLATHEGGGERVAKILVFGGWAGSGRHFDATATAVNRDGIVVFGYNSKKENFQSAAQNVAKNLKKHIMEWQVRDTAYLSKH
jgi:hypothetical protein